MYIVPNTHVITVIVTVTEALVLRPLLEDRGRITESIRILLARRQNETKMLSDHDETSPSIAALSAPSVACSMLAVQYNLYLYIEKQSCGSAAS